MKMILARMFTVMVSLTVVGSSYATEQLPDEMIVAMASSKSVCGGNTGRACPGTAPVPTPPVAASPVIPAPKPLPAPVPQQPAPVTVPQQPAPVTAPQPPAPVTTPPIPAPVTTPLVSTPTPAPTAPAASSTSTSVLAKGDRVQVVKGSNFLNILDAVKGNVLGQQPELALGTVSGTPQSLGGKNWVYVDYDSGVHGWSTDGSLVKYGGATPPASTPSVLPATPTPTAPTTVAATPSPPTPAPSAPSITSYMVLASPASVNAGGSVTATWNAPSGSSAKDWVGLYKVGDSNNSYISGKWGYTNGLTSGTYTTTVPTAAGSYEFRLLQNNGYTDVAHSNSITVTGPVSTPTVSTPSSIPVTTTNGSGGTYYVSSGVGPGYQAMGDDSNPGTEAAPWRTLARAFGGVNNDLTPKVRGGDTLVVRGGEYDTGPTALMRSGSISMLPSGTKSNPTIIKNYPGEAPVWRRSLASGLPFTEDQFRKSVHLATEAECRAFQVANPGLAASAGNPPFDKSFPSTCWHGGGGDNSDGMDIQSQYGTPNAASMVLDLQVNNYILEWIVFDGINMDAKGIAMNVLRLELWLSDPAYPPMGSLHIVFKNLYIANSMKSCMASIYDYRNTADQFDVEFNNVVIHSCGIPFDTNLVAGKLARLNPSARFYHGWYSHGGGLRLINSEVYDNSGTGVTPDSKGNVVRGSYIHDNSVYGILVAGDDNGIFENNVLTNNRHPDGEIHFFASARGIVRNNTLIRGPDTAGNPIGIYIGGYSHFVENNIVYGYDRGIVNADSSTSCCPFSTYPQTVRNNLVFGSPPGQEIVDVPGATPMNLSKNIFLNPLFANTVAPDYRLQAGSPAINAGFANGVTVDRAGSARNDGKIDIGAYEFGN